MKLEILIPHPDGFILGRSLIGAGLLGAPTAGEYWVDVLEHAVTVTFSRGGSTGQLNRPDSGRLSATFKGVDPDEALWLFPGRRVRFVDDALPGAPVLWSGTVADVSVTTGDDYDLTVLTATDVVDDLTNSAVTTAGLRDGNLQTVRQRAAQVIGRSTSQLRFLGADTEAVLRANAYEASVADHLTIACDSVAGAAWRPTADGAVEVLTGVGSTPTVATFTDDPQASAPGYTSLKVAYGTAENVVNVLEVTNRGTDLAGGAADDTTVHTNATSVATYGRRKGEAEFTLRADRVPARAAELLAEHAAVAWTPEELSYRYADLPAVLDLLDPVAVRRRDRSWAVVIVGQTHTIQPKNHVHNVTLTLKEMHA